ncbi:hypothetical protein CKA32_007155 [Geitlerinema sp. FC II]|nr:hypothetical protein CKA32_007155 [Geitlerinema sp. FC II]
MLSFRLNESEHPDINYRNIPIGGLHQLRQAVAEMQKRLPDLTCPTPVSYTHLDVYKRQALYPLGASPLFFSGMSIDFGD